MADEPFKATDEDWAYIEWAGGITDAHSMRTIRELRDRVAALEKKARTAEECNDAICRRLDEIQRKGTGQPTEAGIRLASYSIGKAKPIEECGKDRIQVPPTTIPTPPEAVQEALSVNGVFLGQNGLEGLADADSFWEDRPYGTRLYYGDGAMDYLHRDVLRSAIKLIEQNCATLPTHKPAPTPPAAVPSADSLWEARLHGYERGKTDGYEHGLAAGRAEQGGTPEPEPNQAQARLRQCPTHGQQPGNAWGCPECVRELREEVARLKGNAPEPNQAPAGDGDREELVYRLGWIAAQLADIGWGHDSSSVARAAALLRQPAPEPNQAPAGDGGLVDTIADIIGNEPIIGRPCPAASAVILAVAKWLRSVGNHGSAADLEREANP
jgi:hypothetical protein